MYSIDDVKMNMTGKAELSPKDERGHSYLKLVEVKFKGFIGDARWRLEDTTKNPENSDFGKYLLHIRRSSIMSKFFFSKTDIFKRITILILNSDQ